MGEILTPEDLYGDIEDCQECGAENYGPVCSECGHENEDLAADFHIDTEGDWN